jgi:amino acid transporter
MMREMSKKLHLVVRILGFCVATLGIWGSWYGSFSAMTFVLMIAIGIAAGYAFHTWAEHVNEKCKDEPLTEREKRKYLKWLSRGKWKFAIIHGFSLGLILTFVFGVSSFWWDRGDLFSRNQLMSFGIFMVITLIVFSILGIISGLGVWKGVQNTAQKYSLLKNSSDDEN